MAELSEIQTPAKAKEDIMKLWEQLRPEMSETGLIPQFEELVERDLVAPVYYDHQPASKLETIREAVGLIFAVPVGFYYREGPPNENEFPGPSGQRYLLVTIPSDQVGEPRFYNVLSPDETRPGPDQKFSIRDRGPLARLVALSVEKGSRMFTLSSWEGFEDPVLDCGEISAPGGYRRAQLTTQRVEKPEFLAEMKQALSQLEAPKSNRPASTTSQP